MYQTGRYPSQQVGDDNIDGQDQDCDDDEVPPPLNGASWLRVIKIFQGAEAVPRDQHLKNPRLQCLNIIF